MTCKPCVFIVRGSECISGSVRLVGGSTPYEGLVEICIFQSWQPVCESSFFYPEANVTCNSLGYSASPGMFNTNWYWKNY